MYSFLEITVGIVCVCLPEVRVLLARHMPFLRSSAIHSVSGHTPRALPTNGVGDREADDKSTAAKRTRDLNGGESSSVVELVDTGR